MSFTFTGSPSSTGSDGPGGGGGEVGVSRRFLGGGSPRFRVDGFLFSAIIASRYASLKIEVGTHDRKRVYPYANKQNLQVELLNASDFL